MKQSKIMFIADYRNSKRVVKNFQARANRNRAVAWDSGEQQRLISEAIERGQVTKCKPGYTLDQGTLGLTTFKY